MLHDPQNHRQAYVIDPVIALDQPRDVICSQAHEEHREAEADEEQCRLVTSDRSDEQDIVEAHAEIGDGDLDSGPQESLRPRRPFDLPRRFIIGDDEWSRVEFGPHVVGNPEQQKATGKHEARYLQQLRCKDGEGYQEHQGHTHAEEQNLAAIPFRKTGRERPHDDDIVTRHREVAHDDLTELRKAASREHHPEVQARKPNHS